jgi:hypothetical protein
MVTIPAELSRRYGISPGYRLERKPIEGSTTEICVRVIPKRADLARQLFGRGRHYLESGADPIRELIEERAREDPEEGLS